MGNKTKIRVIDLKKLREKITRILEKEKIDLIFEDGLIEQLKKLKPKKTKCIFSSYYFSRLADDIRTICLEKNIRAIACDLNMLVRVPRKVCQPLIRINLWTLY